MDEDSITDEEWMSDALSGFLKIEPGWHDIVILGEPRKIESKFGKKQVGFSAKVDGAEGVLIPPKRLLRIIATAMKIQGKYPIVLSVERKGTGMETTWKIGAAPGINEKGDEYAG